MNTSQKFDVINRNGEAVDTNNSSWLDAARAAMSYDGYAWECRRVSTDDCRDEYGQIDIDDVREHYGKMALWVKSSHHGNNIYEPVGIRHRDYTEITSDYRDDADAMIDCLEQYEARGDGTLHARLALTIRTKTYVDDVLASVDGETVEKLASDSETGIEAVREFYA